MPLEFSAERALNAGAYLLGDDQTKQLAVNNINAINAQNIKDRDAAAEDEREAKRYARTAKKDILFKTIDVANDPNQPMNVRERAAEDIQKLSSSLGIGVPELASVGELSQGDYDLASKMFDALDEATPESRSAFLDKSNPETYGNPKALQKKPFSGDDLAKAKDNMFKDADPESLKAFVESGGDVSKLTFKGGGKPTVNRYQKVELADGSLGVFDSATGGFSRAGTVFNVGTRSAGKFDPDTGLPVKDTDKGSKLITERAALVEALAKDPENQDLKDRLDIVSRKIDKEKGVTDEEYSSKVSLAQDLISDLINRIETGDTSTEAGSMDGEGISGKVLTWMAKFFPGDFEKDVTGVSGAIKKHGGVLRQFGIKVGTDVEEIDRAFRTLQLSVTEELLNEKRVTDTERATIRDLVGDISITKDSKSLVTSLKSLQSALNKIAQRKGKGVEESGLNKDGTPKAPAGFKPPAGEDFGDLSNDEVYELIQGDIADGLRDPNTLKFIK